jgi:DNA-directed RNA polymerase subunit beta'
MGRNMAIHHPSTTGQERATQRVTYGSKIMVDDGDKVKRGQRLAEWDPYTRPIMTEVEGTASSKTSSTASRSQESPTRRPASPSVMVIDWRSTPRGADLKPAIVIKDDKGKIAKLAVAAMPATCCPWTRSCRSNRGAKVKPGDVLARIPLESAKTKDITGGLPRVAELFEARRPKDHAIIAEIDGTSASAATTRTSAASSSSA